MDNHHSKMDQRIFKEGLSTESISCYLLCCGLSDVGETVSRKNLSGIWNSDETRLDDCLAELEARNIIRRITGSDRDQEGPWYRLVPSREWRAPAGRG